MLTSIRQAILLVLLFFSMVACNQLKEKTQPDGVCNGQQKLTAIYKDYVYDLSGYENSGGGSPFNLFDENSYFDPKNGITGFPQTSPHPRRNADIYFPLNKGGRIVLDLRALHKLSEIYLYDRAEAVDTVWIYSGTMTDWKLKATLVTRGDINAWGWRKIAIDDSTRFLQFRFNSPQANITEAILYGCALQAVPPPPTYGYSGPRLPRRSLKEFLGVNMYNEIPLEWLEPFTWIRMYATADLFDADTVNAYPENKINVSRLGYRYLGQFFRHYSDDLAVVNKKMWYSVRGVPVWMAKLGLGDKDRPITTLGMDPEDPMSYGRHAYMMWTLAAVFGNAAVDTNLLKLGDMIRVTGKGRMNEYENGNEEDAWWVGSKYCSPMEYFAQSSADYDGHMRRLGSKHGIVSADSSSRMIMSGTVGLDTHRVKVLNFLCNTMRPDKQFLWEGGIQYHHYSTNVGTSIAPSRWLAADKGITPEADSLRQRLTKVRDFTYRLQPGVECILGEYGFDKAQKSAQATPIVPGYNAGQSQGIMLLRSINAVAFSGFDRLILYWMKDQEPESSPYIYLTSGLVYQGLDQKVIAYPAWFHVNTLVHHLGNYVPESVISEGRDVWIYRYRHQQQRDSVALFVYSPSTSGRKFPAYALDLSPRTVQALEVNFADQVRTGNAVLKRVTGGKLSVDVDEVPRLILFKE